MDIVTFDVNKRGSTHYWSNGKEINVIEIDGKTFLKYISFCHIFNIIEQDYDFKFKIKYTFDRENYEVNATLDSTGLINNSNHFHGIDILFREKNQTIGPILIGIIMEKQSVDSTSKKQVKNYYKFRELVCNGNGSTVKLIDLKKISQDELNKTILDDEYKAINTTMILYISSGKCNFRYTITNNVNNNIETYIKFEGPKFSEHH